MQHTAKLFKNGRSQGRPSAIANFALRATR